MRNHSLKSHPEPGRLLGHKSYSAPFCWNTGQRDPWAPHQSGSQQQHTEKRVDSKSTAQPSTPRPPALGRGESRHRAPLFVSPTLSAASSHERCRADFQSGFPERFSQCLFKVSNFNEEPFICHPVSRRRVWKEFSQVTEALGNVFPGGKCKAVRHKMFSLWVRVEGPRGGNKTPPSPKKVFHEPNGRYRGASKGLHWKCRKGNSTREPSPSWRNR